MLSVPTKSKDHFNTIIGDIEIKNETNWAKKHFKSILLSYQKHPFFKEHKPFLEDMYLSKKWEKLLNLNVHFYRYIFEILKKDIKIVFASDNNFQGKKSDLVLDMCIKLNASTYIFGGEGKNYADIENFKKNHINLIFQEYNHPKYEQYGNKKSFISHLSILDLIMNYDNKEAKNILMRDNLTI